MNYNQIKITENEAEKIIRELYNLNGKATAQPGELDFNFLIQTKTERFLLKVSRPDADQKHINFQQSLLTHITKSKSPISSPNVIKDIHGKTNSLVEDKSGNPRIVQLLSWIDGRLWSSVNPINDALLFSLGEQAGKITKTLASFDHPFAYRELQWDIGQASWTFDHLNLFHNNQKDILTFFQSRFKSILPELNNLRKSVIHNDVNDNNIIVSDDLINPQVKTIIDYGDALYSSVINDLAITLAYAIMNKPDPLQAALPLIKGYHKSFPLKDEELRLLFILVAMRLVISVTKSALNKQKEPGNRYLLISEKPALNLLEKWYEIHESFAYFSFRECCGLKPHPQEKQFNQWAKYEKIDPAELFPTLSINSIYRIDLSVGSTWIGSRAEMLDPAFNLYKMRRLQAAHPGGLISGGYLESRSLYSTNAFRTEGNNGPQYRTIHLGIDFWVESGTPFHSIMDGTVFSITNNDLNKDYGPTLILEHAINKELTFYSLYGHLSVSTLSLLKNGQSIKRGDLLGYIGNSSENGNWTPHLHFQLILDMMGNSNNFPGVGLPSEIDIWKSICPDPNLLFKEKKLSPVRSLSIKEIIDYRRQHLGKSLCLSYNEPLSIQRGDGVYLIDKTGRKYLDTVNNVAHVGHEHSRVVKAGKEQISVLNTNTRYLHQKINDFSRELLATFPKELSVVHFVNSGSEANELAIRMAKTYSNQNDFIAVESGYHGNSNACINVSSYKFDRKGGKGAPEDTQIVPLPDAFRGLYRGKDTAEKYAAHIQQKIDIISAKGRGLAGFICESIISCGGQIELPENYLSEVYTMVRKAGGLCIADEVQVGCGRTGSGFWGFQLHGVIPDIVTIGKPIGNGHPVAAVVCTREVADSFANGMEYFNTFGGNPVSCAIGLEVLKVIKDEKLQKNAHKVGKYLKQQLKKIQNDFPLLADIRGQGLFLGIELVDTNKSPLADKASYLVNRMKELGILMSIDGPDNNVLKIKPPLVFSIENADELLLRLRAILAEDFMQYFNTITPIN